MISRDQVLHVARLARLRLAEDEIDRMSRELSTVLDHIEKISELDLDGVPPTSHVIEVENVMRPDEPRDELAASSACSSLRPTRPRRDSASRARASERAALKLSAAEAIDAHRAPATSAPATFSAYRERIERHDGELGAFLWTADERRRGRRCRWPECPLAVKDLFCTEGVPTTAGSRILEGHKPLYTATAVRRLAAAGAPMIGKTNMDEFAMGSSNENSGYGIVRNPWDRERVPGGSSGGSAAAVAAGLAPWAIGTDTGGSIRQPAALCGIVGLKPTYGAVSRYGMVAFASSLDQCGPLTRTVTDAALLLEQLVGHDPCDSTSLGLPEAVRMPSRTDLKGLRFGVPRSSARARRASRRASGAGLRRRRSS